MKESDVTRNAALLLTMVIMALLLFGVKDTLVISMPVIVILLLVMGSVPFVKWSIADALLAVTTLQTIVSCCYSVTPLPTFSTASVSVFMFAAYLFQRSAISSGKSAGIVIHGYAVIFFVAMLLAISTFVIYHDAVVRAGFHDTYHFRFMYRPLGYINNMWAEITIVILGVSCLLAGKFRIPMMCMAFVAVLLTFSRGAYISAMVFVVISLLLVRKKRFVTDTLLSLAVAMVAVGAFCKSDMMTTMRMNATTSQQKSVEWRVNKTIASADLIKARPLLGYGNGSYTLVADRTAMSEDQNTFTNMAPNIAVLLLVENGVVGTVPYILLAMWVLYTMWRHRRNMRISIAGCTLVALTVKDMTQATMSQTGVLLFVACSLLALMHNAGSEETPAYVASRRTAGAEAIMFMALMVVYGVVATTNHLHDKELSATVKGMEAVGRYVKTHDKGDIQTACHELATASAQHPYDKSIAFLSAYAKMLYGDNKHAMDIVDKLLEQRKEYGLYLFMKGCLLYNNGMEQQARATMCRAICNMPRLMHSKELANIAVRDSTFYQALKTDVMTVTGHCCKVTSPIKKANYGYILHYWGHRDKAIPLLTDAVGNMPGLQTPWMLLGEKEKYRLLRDGVLNNDNKTASTGNTPLTTDMLELMLASYLPKFETWYCAELPFMDKKTDNHE